MAKLASLSDDSMKSFVPNSLSLTYLLGVLWRTCRPRTLVQVQQAGAPGRLAHPSHLVWTLTLAGGGRHGLCATMDASPTAARVPLSPEHHQIGTTVPPPLLPPCSVSTSAPPSSLHDTSPLYPCFRHSQLPFKPDFSLVLPTARVPPNPSVFGLPGLDDWPTSNSKYKNTEPPPHFPQTGHHGLYPSGCWHMWVSSL
jgi:hypothetical protein